MDCRFLLIYYNCTIILLLEDILNMPVEFLKRPLVPEWCYGVSCAPFLRNEARPVVWPPWIPNLSPSLRMHADCPDSYPELKFE